MNQPPLTSYPDAFSKFGQLKSTSGWDVLAVGHVSATTEFHAVLQAPSCLLIREEIINLRANADHTDGVRIGLTKHRPLDANTSAYADHEPPTPHSLQPLLLPTSTNPEVKVVVWANVRVTQSHVVLSL